MANERRTKRAYECSREDLKNFVFENSLDFELIHTRLAEQYAVDGPDEEDCVHQMATCCLQGPVKAASKISLMISAGGQARIFGRRSRGTNSTRLINGLKPSRPRSFRCSCRR